jgi:decaprenylphospho-beta-D-ribofuranose 2-oxidase
MLPLDQVRRLGGFGRSVLLDGYVFEPETPADLARVFDLARRSGRQVVLRGSGRSYGDAAIGAECLIVLSRGMRRILAWDPASGIIDVEGGVTLEEIWKHTLPHGWWLPVVSGTMFPTISGAVAANIHGKNNFKAGPIGEHVLEIDILPPGESRIRTLTPEEDLFFAVIGSFGLLAPILRVKLQMKRVPCGDVMVTPRSCSSWDDQFEAFRRAYDQGVDYMVSWVDCFAGGDGAGRGIFHSAVHHDARRPETLTLDHQDLPPKIMGVVPKDQVWRFLRILNRRPLMKIVNAAKHFGGKREKPGLQSLAEYSFLLDYVPGWEKAYQPSGFIQYQSFVPRERAPDVFAQQVAMQQAEGQESFLAVLKQHRKDRFLLSHAVDGFSLALDFKIDSRNRERLWKLCHDMNDIVLRAGGRFYFAKDSTLRPQDAETFIGPEALAAFRSYKAQLDPDGLLTSELNRRLHIA